MKKINPAPKIAVRLGRAHAENLELKISNANLLAVYSIDKNQFNKLGILLTNKNLDAIFVASPQTSL